MQHRSNILWPAAIFALLLLSAVTTFGVLIASRSDGGAQVVDDYYRKSVMWDSLASIRQASTHLGWTVNVTLTSNPSQSGAVVAFTDSTGSALEGLTGTVTVSRPQSAVTFGTHTLNADETSPGRYSISFPYSEHGLWDLDVVAKRGEEHFVDRVRIEI